MNLKRILSNTRQIQQKFIFAHLLDILDNFKMGEVIKKLIWVCSTIAPFWFDIRMFVGMMFQKIND